jgi:hypothetical protein
MYASSSAAPGCPSLPRIALIDRWARSSVASTSGSQRAARLARPESSRPSEAVMVIAALMRDG